MASQLSQGSTAHTFGSNWIAQTMLKFNCTAAKYCGEEGSRRDDTEGEASALLPVCQPCFEQHQKSRASGRTAARFDRSGMRARNAAAAHRREARVQSCENRAAAETTGTPTTATGTTAAATSDDSGMASNTKRRRVVANDSSEDESEDGAEGGEGGAEEGEGGEEDGGDELGEAASDHDVRPTTLSRRSTTFVFTGPLISTG